MAPRKDWRGPTGPRMSTSCRPQTSISRRAWPRTRWWP